MLIASPSSARLLRPLLTLAIYGALRHISGMEQEIIKPENAPPPQAVHGFSLAGQLVAASGAALLSLCFVGSFSVATVWAFAYLLGLPSVVLYVLLAGCAVVTVWATVWVAGRAWHVERRLASHEDIDTPVFEMTYYFRKKDHKDEKTL